MLEFARLLARTYGRSVEPVLPGEFRPGDFRHLFTDAAQLKSLGWQPLVPLEEGNLERSDHAPGVAQVRAGCEAGGVLAQAGGEEYLVRLAEEVPSAANAVYYAQLVRDASIRRQLVYKCTSIIGEAYEGRGEAIHPVELE